MDAVRAAPVAVSPPTRRAPLFPGHPLLGSALDFQRDPISTFFRASAACGDVARLRFPLKPYTAHFVRHPDDIRQVLVTNPKNYGKGTRGYRKLQALLGTGLVTSEGDFWRRQRRIANPAFHHDRLARFGEVMATCTQEMLDGWSDRLASGAAFDVSKEMMRVTLRIIGLTMLSTEIGDQASAVGDALNDALHILVARSSGKMMWPDFVPTPTNLRFNRSRRVLDRVLGDVIAQRRRGGAEQEDLLSMLIAATDPETGEAMSDEQLRDEAMTMFLAGHETTANALSWSLYLLSLHPAVERRLRTEIEQVCGDRRPSFAALDLLTYTGQVVKESMRLFPPVWAIARSVVEDDVLGGFPIPQGSWVFASAFVTQRDPRFWPNPEGFDPDRFTPAQEASRPKAAYFPFLLGPRKCIGEGFAMMEARLILASIIQRTRLSLVPGAVVEPDPTITLRPRNGVWMTGSKVLPAPPAKLNPAATGDAPSDGASAPPVARCPFRHAAEPPVAETHRR